MKMITLLSITAILFACGPGDLLGQDGGYTGKAPTEINVTVSEAPGFDNLWLDAFGTWNHQPDKFGFGAGLVAFPFKHLGIGAEYSTILRDDFDVNEGRVLGNQHIGLANLTLRHHASADLTIYGQLLGGIYAEKQTTAVYGGRAGIRFSPGKETRLGLFADAGKLWGDGFTSNTVIRFGGGFTFGD